MAPPAWRSPPSARRDSADRCKRTTPYTWPREGRSAGLPFFVCVMAVRLCLCLSLCLLLGTGCSSAPVAPTSKPASVGATAAVSPAPSPLPGARIVSTDPAIHIFLWGNTATTARDLQLAKSGGFHWVKQRFEWRNIGGKNKGNFEWSEPDRIVDAISQTDLKIVARVDDQPQWASSHIQWPGYGPPDSLNDWTDFLTALASRYRERI